MNLKLIVAATKVIENSGGDGRLLNYVTSETSSQFGRVDIGCFLGSMATCRDSEGWGPVSQLREFDLTPCFEEGILLSTLLVVLLVSALFGSYFLAALTPLERSANSLRVLYVKVVRVVSFAFIYFRWLIVIRHF